MDTKAMHWIEGQRRWLAARGHELDGSGRLLDWRDNLYAPPSERTLAMLADAPSRPLGESGPTGADPRHGEGKPGGLHCPHAIDAVVLNLLEPLAGSERERELAAPLAAHRCEGLELGGALPGPEPDDGGARVELAARLAGPVPTFVLARGAIREGERVGLAGGTLDEPEAWRTLWGCRGLALDLRDRPGRFVALDAAALLRAALVLQRTHGARGYRLLYLWHDLGLAPGHRAIRRKRLEIDRFRMRAGGELDFVALSAREAFERLELAGLLEAGHREYLADRYFAFPTG